MGRSGLARSASSPSHRTAQWAPPAVPMLMTAIVAGLSGCGGGIASEASSSPAGGNVEATNDEAPTGGASIQISVPPGIMVTVVDYTLRSSEGDVVSSTVTFLPSQLLVLLVPNLPAPTRYALDLSMQTGDGAIHCSTSASFDVAVAGTSEVDVIAQCFVTD